MLAYLEPREAEKSCLLGSEESSPAAQKGFGWASGFEITSVLLVFCFLFLVLLLLLFGVDSFLLSCLNKSCYEILCDLVYMGYFSCLWPLKLLHVYTFVCFQCVYAYLSGCLCACVWRLKLLLDVFLDCSHHKWRQGLSVASGSCQCDYSSQLDCSVDHSHRHVLVLQAGLHASLVFIWWLLGTQTAVLILAKQAHYLPF